MHLEPWKKTLYIVWLTQFIALTGGGMVFPFLPLYIRRDLGVESTDQVALYAGLSGLTFGLAMFIFSPIWGSLSDRFGRKKLLMRAYVGATIIMALPAFCTNINQFLVVRTLQGMFTGTVPAAASLVAASTPPKHVAYAMGLLQVALSVSGTAGPLIGGVVADSVGLKTSFLVTSVAFGLGGLLLLFGVKEEFVPPPERKGPWESFKRDLRTATTSAPILMMVGFLFLINGALAFGRPIIPLFVDLIDPVSGGVKESGYAFAALAVTSALAAFTVGHLSTRFGSKRLLVIALLGAGLAYFPVATAGTIPMLVLFMAIVGLFSGGAVPAANALLSINSPADKQGSAFGLAGSGNALAMALMPLLGGLVAAGLGIRAVFIALGVGTLATAVLASMIIPGHRQVAADTPPGAVLSEVVD